MKRREKLEKLNEKMNESRQRQRKSLTLSSSSSSSPFPSVSTEALRAQVKSSSRSLYSCFLVALQLKQKKTPLKGLSGSLLQHKPPSYEESLKAGRHSRKKVHRTHSQTDSRCNFIKEYCRDNIRERTLGK